MIGYAQTGSGEHRQVVGAVAHSYCLGDIDIFYLSEQTQELGFAGAVDNRSEMTPGEFAVDDFKLVGIRVVKSELLLEIVAEVGETSRKWRQS